jgi:hypothetical protein
MMQNNEFFPGEQARKSAARRKIDNAYDLSWSGVPKLLLGTTPFWARWVFDGQPQVYNRLTDVALITLLTIIVFQFVAVLYTPKELPWKEK